MEKIIIEKEFYKNSLKTLTRYLIFHSPVEKIPGYLEYAYNKKEGLYFAKGSCIVLDIIDDFVQKKFEINGFYGNLQEFMKTEKRAKKYVNFILKRHKIKAI